MAGHLGCRSDAALPSIPLRERNQSDRPDGQRLIRSMPNAARAALCPLDGYPLNAFARAADSCRVNPVDSAERRRERAMFETDRHLVAGDVTLPPEGYQSRFSDSLNRVDVAFIPLTNAEITSLDNGEVTRRDFVVLGKAHVKIAYPVGAGD